METNEIVEYLFYIFFGVVAYGLGSIPTGKIVAWQGKSKGKGVDITQHGSGNIGFTNVWRVCGLKHGLLVLLIDIGKAALAIYLAYLYDPENKLYLSIIAVLIILGNVRPVWFKGGGKGIATAAGVLAVIMTYEVLIALGALVVMVAVSRRMSLGSLTAGLTVFASHLILTEKPWASQEIYYTLLCLILFLLVVYTHRKNIKQIIKGNEPKVF